MKKLPSRNELIAMGYPYGKVTDDIPFGNPTEEWMRSEPTVKVYVPAHDMASDCDNCVLAVVPTPNNKELLAIWTQSTCEGYGDNRIVIARSTDGIHWSKPKNIIGAINPGDRQCSWGMPMYTKSGRLYVFFTRVADKPDLPKAMSGDLGFVYSDDDGHTWSKLGITPMPRCRYDHPDHTVAKNWWSFQAPIRDVKDRYICGFTIQTSPSVITQEVRDAESNQSAKDTRAAFIRFENLDDDPEPEDIRVSILPEEGLEVPRSEYPVLSTAQEAAPVLLPDARLFATMRTKAGFIFYTVGTGDKWSVPKPMLGWDKQPIPHPLGPCPIYGLQDGTFLCLANMNSQVRSPLYLLLGRFDPTGEQPIRFGKPFLFIDVDGVALGARKKCTHAPTYTAITQWNGKTMLWYPDRKYQILGKEITPEMLDEMKAGL